MHYIKSMTEEFPKLEKPPADSEPLNPPEPAKILKQLAIVPEDCFMAIFDVCIEQFSNSIEIEKFERDEKKKGYLVTILLKNIKAIFGSDTGSRKRLDNVFIPDDAITDPKKLRAVLVFASGNARSKMQEVTAKPAKAK